MLLIVKCRQKKQQKNGLDYKSANIKQGHFIGFAKKGKHDKESHDKNHEKRHIQYRGKFDGFNIFEQDINHGQ